MSKTDDVLRARFTELLAEREAIASQTEPLRAQRDEIIAQARAIEQTAAPLDAQIKELEGPLFDINNEIATVSRALRPAGELISLTAS